MSFNFGAQSFKHEPSEDYIAVCQAPKERIKNSGATSASSGDGSNVVKQVANAPQAIIIEVLFFLSIGIFNYFNFQKLFFTGFTSSDWIDDTFLALQLLF